MRLGRSPLVWVVLLLGFTAAYSQQADQQQNSIFRRIRPYGDFRFRLESDDRTPGADRDRARIRMRLGANITINDQSLIGVRLVTGSRSDPHSTHVTLGNGFDDFEVSFDRAFFEWRPGWRSDPRVTVGKFAHGFWITPLYGELVWDADIQPEGVLAGLGWQDLRAVGRLEFDGGLYLLTGERGGGVYSAVTQVAVHPQLASGVRSIWGLGYYHYSDLTNDDNRTLLDVNRGNATVDLNGDGVPDRYASDFSILNPVATVVVDRSIPVIFTAEYIRNLRATIPGDQGWVLGAGVGRSGPDRGHWFAYYQFQVVEQDAVFSPIAQDDFLFAVDHRSHVAGARYQVLERVELHLWALASRRESQPDSDYQWRVRLDLNARF